MTFNYLLVHELSKDPLYYFQGEFSVPVELFGTKDTGHGPGSANYLSLQFLWL